MSLQTELVRLAAIKRNPTGAPPAAPGSVTGLPVQTHQPIDASAAGDNILIAPTGYSLQIMELIVWNTAAQTLIFKDGAGSGAQRLLRLTGFPQNTGYSLGFTGEPHMVVSPGNPFVLNLDTGAQVDGYIRYLTS